MNHSRQMGSPKTDFAAKRLAVLIDGDNAQALVVEALLSEVALYGEATVKRIYGDFTSSSSSQWKGKLNRHAICPVQQFAYTSRKNATDSRLIIDAMDLLHRGNIEGFCIVSSDSDFTGLANRIREEGLSVYGFGNSKTPEAFRNACHKFVFTENLKPLTGTKDATLKKQASKSASKEAKPAAKKKTNQKKEKDSAGIHVDLLKEAVEKTSDETGWANLGQLGNYLQKVKPDFDPRSEGCKNLTDLITKFDGTLELQDRAPAESPTKIMYVRIR